MNEPKQVPCCSQCSEPASVFLTLVVGAHTQSKAFCAKCLPAGILTSPLPATAAGLKLAIPAPAGRGRCPACGFRWVDFERTQRMGCAQCYTSHAQEADTLIARSQPAMTHIGRHPLTPAPTPPTHGQDMSKDKTGKDAAKTKITRTPTKLTLEELQEALRAAVAKEDYEKAAKLRDKISAQNTASK